MKDKLMCLLRRIYDNSFVIGMIIFLWVLLTLLFYGCTTTPGTPGTPGTPAPTIEEKKEIRKVEELTGRIVISNNTAAVYRIRVRDDKANVLYVDYIRPNEEKFLELDLGEYEVCIQSSGLWGKTQCFDKVVMPGDHEDNQWKLQRKTIKP